MENLPIFKMENINLRVSTAEALVTTIDCFRFTHEKQGNHITVEFQESENYEWVDEMATGTLYLEEIEGKKDLERIAINWIFKHVELVRGNKIK